METIESLKRKLVHEEMRTSLVEGLIILFLEKRGESRVKDEIIMRILREEERVNRVEKRLIELIEGEGTEFDRWMIDEKMEELNKRRKQVS